VSTRVEGATALILVTVHATLSAGPAHLMLSAREGPAPGTWRYSLSDGKEHRIQYGPDRRQDRSHGRAQVRRRHAYAPGTTERGLLEQFAESDDNQYLPARTHEPAQV
jgi:hypothetical protein